MAGPAIPIHEFFVAILKSEHPNKAAFPAKQYPFAIAILRHRPDNRAHVENEGILRPAIWVVTSTSPGRPPPPSVYITIGRANLSACSVIRSNFW